MIDRRRRDEPDAFLDWKVRIFFAGAALLAAGVVTGRDVLALLAVAVLVVGALLILGDRVRRRRQESEQMAYYAEDDPDPSAEPFTEADGAPGLTPDPGDDRRA